MSNQAPEFRVDTASPSSAGEIAALVGELLDEIMQAIGSAVFHFDLAETTNRLWAFLSAGKYTVLVARETATGRAIGFVSVYESYALYAQGVYGTVPEFYVAPAYRSRGVGSQLLATLKVVARQREWKRLELTTPPLPQFERTLSFYTREGFSVSGGRKLKLDI